MKSVRHFFFMLIITCTNIIITTKIDPKRFDDRLMSEVEFQELVEESHKDDLCLDYSASIQPEDLDEIRSVNPKKSLTFMVFMAADNDLHYFAWKNIKQMELVGSNDNVNIVIQLNTPGYLNPTKRYIVKNNKRILVQDSASPNQKLNSGSPYTLIDFASWAATHYPAEEYALILWNHGTGAYDPGFAKTVNPCQLFYRNPSSNMLEIDRGFSYINLILQTANQKQIENQKRGVCFDETFKSYISNQDLEFALHEIVTKVLRGKKLGVIGFDACLMAMAEIANVTKNYAQYLVASEEVEYGTGWDYKLVLQPLLQKAMRPRELAQQIVFAYDQAYGKIINDYTQSAIDLVLYEKLEENIHIVATLLVQALSEADSNSTINTLRKCKSTQYCTCFDEPSYVDLGHFYKNIQQHLQHLTIQDKQKEIILQKKIKEATIQGLTILSQTVIANKTGQKLKNAQGLSIYFPEHSISQAYLKSNFSLTNNWSMLLATYILG